ncbi:hypothetical protein GM921_03960 [Pedobacter sp. LMG 31464]|uniref:KAP NTPase domain-containing protein n=1 Tax=Pedobacter planticolens TaxID=2679964 RepID=A0A923DWY8_9SPHI|nr:P-loop NTPase fold protein [Pedobacter planticolens]MBB2144625.1 hypothetical protein [Pedobacter planticolens]
MTWFSTKKQQASTYINRGIAIIRKGSERINDFFIRSFKNIVSILIDDYYQKSLWSILFITLMYLFACGWLWKSFDALLVKKVLANLKPMNLGYLGSLIYFLVIGIPGFKILANCYRKMYKMRPLHIFLIGAGTILYWTHRPDYVQAQLFDTTVKQDFLKIAEYLSFMPPPLAGIAQLLQLLFKSGLVDPIVALISFGCIILSINLFRFARKPKNSSLLIQDMPISLLKDDKFNRKIYFEPLVNEIRSIEFSTEQAFAIGINSMWGYGKTSLLQILKKDFEEKEPHTVYLQYNPWMSTAKSGLTMDFFVQLDQALSEHIETENLIMKYGRALSKIDVEKNPLKSIASIFEHESSLKDKHDEVKELLMRIKKRVLVVIDDMDRLDNSEVMEVLRLIRNTANFPRIIFVAAYDKNYLSNALKSHSILNQDKYLQKIFDLEIMLPKIENMLLKELINDVFKASMDNLVMQAPEKQKLLDQFRDLIFATNSSTDPKMNLFRGQIWNVITNKRDIIRFVNSMSVIFQVNQKWVYLPDLAILELIKMMDHNCYLELSSPDNYLAISSSSLPKAYKLITQRSTLTFTARSLGHTNLKEDILESKNRALTDLISSLFTPATMSDHQSDKALRIVDNFENYFIYAEKNLPASTFAQAITP